MSSFIPYDKLSKEQKMATDNILSWYHNSDSSQVFSLAGYAGTGKSTLIQTVVSMIKSESRYNVNVKYLTYTGKASIVLSIKGLPTTTIHSFMYIPEGSVVEDDGQEKLLFTKRDYISNDIVLLIVDEFSMVPDWIWDDLLSFGVKVLAVGDPGQLPPVAGNKNELSRDGNYDVILRTIHRQAEDNPIIQLSRKVREGKPIKFGMYRDSKGVGKVAVIPYNRVKDSMFLKASQILTGFNTTRRNLNNKIRGMLGFSDPLPEKGDKVICTYNNWDKQCKGRVLGDTGYQTVSLVNGLLGYCEDDLRNVDEVHKRFRMDFRPEFFANNYYSNLLVSICPFYNQKEDLRSLYYADEFPNQFDFGYAITVHKCISGDTYIGTNRGLEKIKDVLPSDLKEQEYRNFKHPIYTQYGKKETSHAFFSGEEDTYIIKTRMGLELECSERHPIQIMNNKGEKEWVKAPNLESGMRLPIPLGLNISSSGLVKTEEIGFDMGNSDSRIPKVIDESLAELLGALTSDGFYNDKVDYRVEFHKTYKDYFNLIRSKVIDIFGVSVTSRNLRKNYPNSFYFHNKKVRSFLERCGLDYSTAPDKKIPWVILRSPINIQKAFLRALFSGDGCADKTSSVRFRTSSKELSEQVQLLLLNLGIVCKREVTELEDENHNDTWCVSIYSNQIEKFRDDIGFIIEYKQRRLEKHKKGIMRMWGDIPGGKYYCNELRNELRQRGKNYPEAKSIGRLLSSVINNRFKLFNRHIDDILNSILYETPSLTWFKDRHKENIFYDEIVSIERGRSKVYDVTVPEYHEFITNGIVSHNSQGSQWGKILLYNEKLPSYSSRKHMKWLYTGVTRAEDRLILVTKKDGYGIYG